MDYDLTRLGSREFEHLTQALALKVLGAQIGVFGDGPDGGREAAYTGKVSWSMTSEPEVWDGYLVVQAKFHQRPLGTRADTDWFIQQVTSELKHWSDKESGRRKRGRRLPDYLLLSTNVVLSPTEGGGIERVDALLRDYAKDVGLKGWRVWHHDQICRMLDDAPAIRMAFSGLITPGDVLARLQEMLQGQAADLGETLTAHAAKDLLAQQWVRLGQAGQPDNEKLSLDRVAVDLPARLEVSTKEGKAVAEQAGAYRFERLDTGSTHVTSVPVVAYVIRHGDRVLRPSIIGTDVAPHLVLVGGPGQGKTTVGQLIAQTYRTALLTDAAQLGREAKEVVTSTVGSLARLVIPRPRSTRWPIQVDLATYGDAIAGGQNLSLLRWLADQITARGGIDVTASQMKSWLRSWPWLLVLDGLDEVASFHARSHLMRQISDFLVDAANVDADLLIVATTRPQGYTGEFNNRDYQHLTLEPLSPTEALQYARRLAEVRHHNDDDLREQTIDRVQTASREPLTARLMRTPLQVTIMSLLLERRPRPPQDRHGLFEAYYDTIYAREVAKPGTLARLLDEHRADIHALHEHVGLRLQVLAESEGDADASMPAAELHSLAVARLKTEGHGPEAADNLAHEIVKAATYRLVLLVPKVEVDVGFEVRSLQEFMAARAIVSGPDRAVLERLRVTAPAVHWRNMWLLAAGRIFATREHLRAQVVGLLREIDAEDLLATVIPTGPDLALDLLDDDLAARSPQFRRQLLMHALEFLEQPPMMGILIDSCAIILQELARNEELRRLIVNALEQGIAAGPDRRATTWLLLHSLRTFNGVLESRAQQMLTTVQLDSAQKLVLNLWAGVGLDDSHVRRALPPDTRRRRLSDYVAPGLEAMNLTGAAADGAQALLSGLRSVKIVTFPPDHKTCIPLSMIRDTPNVGNAVSNSETADAIAMTLLDIPPESWGASSILRFFLWEIRQRQPVGERLLELGPEFGG